MDRQESGARAEAVRLRVRELGPEQREHGRRLLRRSDALANAYAAVLGENTPDGEAKKETLAALAQMRDEAAAEFRRYREEVGIPSPAHKL